METMAVAKIQTKKGWSSSGTETNNVSFNTQQSCNNVYEAAGEVKPFCNPSAPKDVHEHSRRLSNKGS